MRQRRVGCLDGRHGEGKLQRNQDAGFFWALEGPYLMQILGDLGAEVIKIERPALGNDERASAPIAEKRNGLQSGYFMLVNRGKVRRVQSEEPVLQTGPDTQLLSYDTSCRPSSDGCG